MSPCTGIWDDTRRADVVAEQGSPAHSSGTDPVPFDPGSVSKGALRVSGDQGCPGKGKGHTTLEHNTSTAWGQGGAGIGRWGTFCVKQQVGGRPGGWDGTTGTRGGEGPVPALTSAALSSPRPFLQEGSRTYAWGLQVQSPGGDEGPRGPCALVTVAGGARAAPGQQQSSTARGIHPPTRVRPLHLRDW